MNAYMIVSLFITFVSAIVFVSLYSRYRLKVVEGLSGKKISLFSQFNLRDENTNFEKYVSENQERINESDEITYFAKKAILYYWLQGIAGMLLFFQFIVYAFIR